MVGMSVVKVGPPERGRGDDVPWWVCSPRRFGLDQSRYAVDARAVFLKGPDGRIYVAVDRNPGVIVLDEAGTVRWNLPGEPGAAYVIVQASGHLLMVYQRRQATLWAWNPFDGTRRRIGPMRNHTFQMHLQPDGSFIDFDLEAPMALLGGAHQFDIRRTLADGSVSVVGRIPVSGGVAFGDGKIASITYNEADRGHTTTIRFLRLDGNGAYVVDVRSDDRIYANEVWLRPGAVFLRFHRGVVGYHEIFAKMNDDGTVRVIFSAVGVHHTFYPSPDGKYLVAISHLLGPSRLTLTRCDRLEDNEPVVLAENTDLSTCEWSPDSDAFVCRHTALLPESTFTVYERLMWSNLEQRKRFPIDVKRNAVTNLALATKNQYRDARDALSQYIML